MKLPLRMIQPTPYFYQGYFPARLLLRLMISTPAMILRTVLNYFQFLCCRRRKKDEELVNQELATMFQ